MRLTLNILLDRISGWNYESYAPDMGGRSFSRPSLPPREIEKINEEFIYICGLSEALRTASLHSGACWMCVRDRIKDPAENEDSLRGMIIINENLDLETLFSAVLEFFITIGDWVGSMRDAVLKNRPLQEIIDLSEDIIGNTINVSDSALTLLARTRGIDTDDQASLDLARYGYHSDATLEYCRKHKRFEMWEKHDFFVIYDSGDFSKYPMVNRIFRFRNTYFTHVVMVCDHHAPTPGLLDLFGLLTDTIAIHAEREWERRSALSHNYDSFFVSLLAGKLTEKKEIEEFAGRVGLSIAGRYTLVKLSVEAGLEPSLGRLGLELGEMLISAKVFIYDSSVVFLHPAQSLEAMDAPEKKRLEDLFLKYRARGGISDSFSSLETLPRAYEQAAMALKYGGELPGEALIYRFSEDGEKSALTNYQDKVLYCLLGERPDGGRVWRESVYGQAILSLCEYDRLHGSNNVKLLHCHLQCERKPTETASRLHMHRNNVLYRIGRIEEMLGLDLGDRKTRIGLEISLLCLQIFGI